MKPWRLLVGGNVVSETPRHEMLRDTINHLAHHRGQMTVYLRLLGAKVPAIYGPSADDRSFASRPKRKDAKVTKDTKGHGRRACCASNDPLA